MRRPAPPATPAPAPATPYRQLERIKPWLGLGPGFHNLSLTLRLSEHGAVLGPNGSGRSTLVPITHQIESILPGIGISALPAAAAGPGAGR